MQVDIWSDVVCPWCYIGKRRFESALARFPHRDQVEVVFHSFELDPHAQPGPAGSGPDRLAAKYGLTREQAVHKNAQLAALAAAERIEMRFDLAQPSNTFDAHRLLHLAREQGLQVELKERLFRAYFTEGQSLSDQSTLARLASEVGLSSALDVLGSDSYTEEVRFDEQEAAALGINGVPFFVLGGRYGVSGAQPADLLLSALDRAWTDTVGSPVPCSTDESCTLASKHSGD
jgi:predicted DsbA family dithiol-disulfide isomerase